MTCSGRISQSEGHQHSMVHGDAKGCSGNWMNPQDQPYVICSLTRVWLQFVYYFIAKKSWPLSIPAAVLLHFPLVKSILAQAVKFGSWMFMSNFNLLKNWKEKIKTSVTVQLGFFIRHKDLYQKGKVIWETVYRVLDAPQWSADFPLSFLCIWNKECIFNLFLFFIMEICSLRRMLHRISLG